MPCCRYLQALPIEGHHQNAGRAYSGPHFIRFVAQLVGASQAPPLKEPHGSRHGRPERTCESADLLLDGIKAWHRRKTTGRPDRPRCTPRCRLRPGGAASCHWTGPKPHALGWCLLQAQRSGALEQAGIEFRKYRRTGQWRPTLYRFPLHKASQTTASQPA
jgi:hypothetical protein